MKQLNKLRLITLKQFVEKRIDFMQKTKSELFIEKNDELAAIMGFSDSEECRLKYDKQIDNLIDLKNKIDKRIQGIRYLKSENENRSNAESIIKQLQNEYNSIINQKELRCF